MMVLNHPECDIEVYIYIIYNMDYNKHTELPLPCPQTWPGNPALVKSSELNPDPHPSGHQSDAQTALGWSS